MNNMPKSLEIYEDNLKTCLGSIRNAVSKFWKDFRLLDHYTRHDIEHHSEKVIQLLGKLLECGNCQLNDHE